MAYAYVRYICDGKKLVVPTSFIKNFIHEEFVPGEKYPVFWSPVKDQKPADVERKQGKIVEVDKLAESSSSSNQQVLAGYYSAEVLMVADTAKQVEETINKKRVSAPSLKKSESLEWKAKGKNSTRKGSANKDYVSKGKEKKLIVKGEETTVSDWKKKFEPKNCETKKEASESNKKDSESSSECNSDDELVPKLLVKEKERENMTLRRANKMLQERNEKLLERNDKLEDLNIMWQTKMLEIRNNENEKRVIEQGANLTVPDRKEKFELEKEDQSELEMVIVEDHSELKEENHSGLKKEDCTSKEEDHPESKKEDSSSSSMSKTDNPSTPKSQKRRKLMLELTPTKMRNINRGVKPSSSGDSMFVKNLAHTVFSVPLLLESSVSGMKSNKSDIAYPPLPEAGMIVIENKFSERLDQEKISDSEKKIRLEKMSKYVGEKINDLRKAQKKKSVKNVVNPKDVSPKNVNPEGDSPDSPEDSTSCN